MEPLMISRDDFENLTGFEINTLVRKNRVVVVQGMEEMAQNDFLRLGQKLFTGNHSLPLEDQLLHWSFGPIMELKVKEDSLNYLFTDEKVPFHWDGAFFTEPELLLFQCLEIGNSVGGETFFCDAVAAAERFREELERRNLDPRLGHRSLVYRTEKKAHYGGTISHSLIRKHPKLDRDILRYGEPVCTEFNPVQVEWKADHHELEIVQLHQLIQSIIYDKKYYYEHKWQKGDVLIADNFATLHGRNRFDSSGRRSIRRAQVLSGAL